jgi:opacity protein-like surface antigen
MSQPYLGTPMAIRLGAAALLGVVALSSAASRADENLFGYSYGSETLPKGAWETYLWSTWRTGKGNGTYDAVDLRLELERGFTDRFQASLYLNGSYWNTYNTGPIDEGTGEYKIPNQSTFAYKGVQLALKYALLSPYKDGVGLALYLEPGYFTRNSITGQPQTEYELEPRIIVQKNFLEDRLISVLNLTGEFEWEREDSDEPFEKELKLEATAGLSYLVAPNWYVGVEGRYKAVYPNWNLGNREAWAFFAGPAIHYATRKWWFTLTVLPQISGAPNDPGRSSNLQLDEFERLEVRLKIGYYF